MAYKKKYSNGEWSKWSLYKPITGMKLEGVYLSSTNTIEDWVITEVVEEYEDGYIVWYCKHEVTKTIDGEEWLKLHP